MYTTPCIGDSDYLRKQWSDLNIRAKRYPSIITTKHHHRFGQLDSQYFAIWTSLAETTGIEFDLLYDPQGWITLLNNRQLLTRNVIYIHCGGISGNQSMLSRYNRL